MLLEPGGEVDEYRLVRRVGAGGFSEVWLATNAAGQPRALKFPRIAELTEHLRREAALSAQVPDLPERVVGVEAARLAHDPPYLVVPWVEGVPLEPPEDVPSPPEILAGLTRADEVAALLQGLHARGIVHGDVKPQNVLVDRSGQCWLVDLGLAVHHVRARQQRSLAQSLVSVDGAPIAGTLEYMAPEVLAGSPPSPASDLYALGVLLHQLLTGRSPSYGVAPGALNPLLASGVEPLLRRLLDRDAGRRPTVDELRRALSRLVREERACLGRRNGHARRRIFHARMAVLRHGLGALAWLGTVLGGLAFGAWMVYRTVGPVDVGLAAFVSVPVGFLGLLLGITTINAWWLGVPERDYKQRTGHPLWTFMMQ